MIRVKTIDITITIAALFISVFLTACGGGGSSIEDKQKVTSFQVQSWAYSRPAVLSVSGEFLQAGMTATTSACKDLVLSTTQGNSELAVFNCPVVTATGEHPLTITGTNGKVLIADSIAVPLPQVALATSQGTVIVQLDPVAAPVSVNNFLTYVSSEFYNKTLFHRVIAGFVVQGGGYTQGLIKKAGQLAPIVLESNNGLSNTRGTLAMARSSLPNSATSEFYVNLVDNRSLDYQSPANLGYAVFGKVLTGMETIDGIAALQTMTTNGFANVPSVDVTLQSAQQIK